MKRLVILFFLAFFSGCASVQDIEMKVRKIRQDHDVIVKVDNSLSHCLLFGNLPSLLDQIDNDLKGCPQFFKEHIGSVIIEESFMNNTYIGISGLIMRGYVNPSEKDWPIHIKNRSLLEKTLLPAFDDKNLFLHEATHSFEFNMAMNYKESWSNFRDAFCHVGEYDYGGGTTWLACALIPVPIKPKGYASFYGTIDFSEDFAETYCYLRRHDIELIKQADPILYEKCQIVKKFVEGDMR